MFSDLEKIIFALISGIALAMVVSYVVSSTMKDEPDKSFLFQTK